MTSLNHEAEGPVTTATHDARKKAVCRGCGVRADYTGLSSKSACRGPCVSLSAISSVTTYPDDR